MTVKKIFLFSTLLACLFLSCKKNNSSSSNSNYHFTATIDGKAQSFNVSPLAIIVTNGGVSEIAMEGFTGTTAASGEVMAISWANAAPGSAKFGVGTYYDTVSNYSIIGVYNPTVSQSYVSGSTATGYASGLGVTGVNHLKVVITSVDSTAVKGTFSGDFYYNSDITAAKKVVTNGDFFVPWKH